MCRARLKGFKPLSYAWNELAFCYMYDKPDSQYSKLVMAARKAKTETPGSGASEVRPKSAVVELGTQPKATSSKPL